MRFGEAPDAFLINSRPDLQGDGPVNNAPV